VKTIILFLNYLLPALYWATVWSYAKAFFKNSALAKKVKTPLLVITIAIHFLYLIARTISFEHPPITNIYEILSVLAFTTALSYLAIEFITKVKSTGYFVLIISFFFQLLSTVLIQEVTSVNPVLRNYLLGFHVISALLGYSAFAISAVYGFLYIMLYHHIKSKRFGVIYDNLPNLEKLERMATVSVITGFLLLTVAIIVGVVWLPRAFEHYSYFDPKLVGTIVIWLMYGIGLLAKQSIGWQGRKIMVLSIVGFAVAMLSLTVVNVFLSGFHNFF
jgi:ABC-type transport system involved in cytochrome c biogenesis permease subunit